VDATTGPLGDPGANFGVAWADYDKDGDLDLYVCNMSGSSKLLRNNGGGVFVDATSGQLTFATDATCAAWADYDNDGDLDLYVATVSGNPNWLFRNDGGGVFVSVSGVFSTTANSRGVAWGDYDNDGDLDLYVANVGSANRLFRNDGGAGFTDVTSGPLGDTGQGGGVAWGDYDNDGDLDLYLANYNSADRLFRNDGGGAFVDAAAPPLGDAGPGLGVAWGDYDNDGDLDLYLVRDNQPNRLYRNDIGTSKNWLKVKLVGTVSNRDAIGARVKVVAGGVTRIREVSGGSGYCSQDALVQSFGLGAATQMTKIEVRWPSGITQAILSPPAVNQQITIVEASGLDVPGGDGATSAFERTSPNPFASNLRIDLALGRGGPVSVAIYGVTGDRVASVLDGALPAGRHQLAWDGRDASGRPVSNGIYFVRVESPGLREARRIVKLR
jgi:hypothetical protein